MSPHLYLAKYDPINYHCVHFAFDLLKDTRGIDVSPLFRNALLPIGNSHLGIERKNLVKLTQPENFCFAFLSHRDDDKLHLGIFNNGFITHLTQTGVRIEKPSMMGLLYKISYYRTME